MFLDMAEESAILVFCSATKSDYFKQTIDKEQRNEYLLGPIIDECWYVGVWGCVERGTIVIAKWGNEAVQRVEGRGGRKWRTGVGELWRT